MHRRRGPRAPAGVSEVAALANAVPAVRTPVRGVRATVTLATPPAIARVKQVVAAIHHTALDVLHGKRTYEQKAQSM